jgi:acyl carrier protein
MNDDQTRQGVLRLLGDIAPEADLPSLDPEARIRDQLDIDSMDALNFLISIHEEFGVDIPEADYPRLATINAIVDYLGKKQAEQAR